MAHLTIKNLYKKYDQRSVIKNINLEIEKGEIIAFLGENGCGKSTLLKIIAGLENSDAGAAFLDNQKIDSPANKLVAGHAEIQLVNQQYKLNMTLNIKDNILLPIKDYDRVYQQKMLEDAVEIFKLEEFLKRKPSQLSGGQQQRVAIARAMVQKPALLLLDEPFSNQDMGNKQLLKDQIIEIVRALNTTLIFVTHDAQEALSISDKVAIMDQGKILQFDTPKSVYNHPASERTAWLTGEINLLNYKALTNLVGIDQTSNAIGIRPENISFTYHTNEGLVVSKCEFVGAYHRLSLDLQGTPIVVYDYTKSVLINDRITLSIPEDKLIYW